MRIHLVLLVHLPRFFLYNFVRFLGVCKNGVVIVPSVLLPTGTLWFPITAEREYKWGYNGVLEDVLKYKLKYPHAWHAGIFIVLQ